MITNLRFLLPVSTVLRGTGRFIFGLSDKLDRVILRLNQKPMTEEDYKLLGEFVQRAGMAYIENDKIK